MGFRSEKIQVGGNNMIIRQISIFVENRRGRLAEVLGILADHEVEILALSIADTTEFGILRLIVKNPDKAAEAMKQSGYTAAINEVIAIRNEKDTRGLADAMRVLSEEGVNVEYMYAFIGMVDSRSFIILRVNDNQQAVNALQKAGISVLHVDEIYHPKENQ